MILNRCLLVVCFFLSFEYVFSQSFSQSFLDDTMYYEGDIAGTASFLVKEEDRTNSFVNLGGINIRSGIGLHDPDEIFFLGINSGADINYRSEIFILPVYLNAKMGFDIFDSNKIMISFGYGRSFQIGHEHLSGYFKKYSIGYGVYTEKENFQSIFLEINNYGFDFPNSIRGITLNLGLNYTFM